MKKRQKRILKAERAFFIAKLKEGKAQGLMLWQIADSLGRSRSSIISFAQRHGVRGWPIGAATKDQWGEKNVSYKGGTCRSTIRRITKRVLSEAGVDLFLCNRCGLEGKVEHPRHHKDRNRSNNKLENLEVLCVSCHTKDHMCERVRSERGRFVA